MTHRSTNPTKAEAFLKRGSQVRILPGTLLSASNTGGDPPPWGLPIPVENRVSRTDPVHGRIPCEVRS